MSQLEDNITEPTIQDVTDAMETELASALASVHLSAERTEDDPDEDAGEEDVETPTDYPEMFNLHQACKLISAYYERSFKRLKFIPPAQIIDGGVAEFNDEVLKIVVATCRIRVRNNLHISQETGELKMDICLSDLAFQRGGVELGITYNK